ncbi:MAG: hypothetical protein WBX11_17640 [Thiobacillaceae bacterium]
MMVIVGVKEDLSEPRAIPALETFGHDTGIKDLHVSNGHPHFMFVEYDENQLRWPDIINHMDQIGLHGKVCGN